VERVIQLSVPPRVESMSGIGSRRRFDRRGAVVTGVVACGREATHVAAVTDEIRGHDRTDTRHVSHRRRRMVERRGDATLELNQVGVSATNLAEELDGETATFDTDRIGRLDAT
jgi:hypothetical protein